MNFNVGDKFLAQSIYGRVVYCTIKEVYITPKVGKERIKVEWSDGVGSLDWSVDEFMLRIKSGWFFPFSPVIGLLYEV